MHPNPVFRGTPEAHSLAMLRARSFGTLCVNGDPLPLLAHVPFLLNADGTGADLHLVRSNPIAHLCKNRSVSVQLAVMGPDSYISPDWYEVPDQVPTWNYVAIHLSGTLALRPQDELKDLLDRQSAHFERQLAPKPEWTSAKMTEGVMARMMRAIVPMRFTITDMESTWKLGQNKADAVRKSAASQVGEAGIGSGIADLAALMDTPPR